MIDQGLPFRFAPLAGDGDVQLVLINCDGQGLEAPPAVRADVVKGMEQRQGSLQLFGVGYRLLEQQLELQTFLGGATGGRNSLGKRHRRVIV